MKRIDLTQFDGATEGPWCVIGKQGTAIWAGDTILAGMTAARTNHRQARKDAELMSAAPTLRDELRRAYVEIDQLREALAERVVREVIDPATSKPENSLFVRDARLYLDVMDELGIDEDGDAIAIIRDMKNKLRKLSETAP